MKVTLESTSTTQILKTPDGSVPVRLFEGSTESGIAVHAYLARLYPNGEDDAERVERELAGPHRDASPAVLARLGEPGHTSSPEEEPFLPLEEPTRREVLLKDAEEGRVVESSPELK
jgi:hypothetical protein